MINDFEMRKEKQELSECIEKDNKLNNEQEPQAEVDQQEDILGDELDTKFWIKVSFILKVVKCTNKNLFS